VPRGVASPDVETTRRLLMRAAESCLSRYGLAKTTMDDIASEAGMSRTTVYRYFADRDALILAIVEHRCRKLIERARGFIESRPTFADSLVDGLVYMVEQGRKDVYVKMVIGPQNGDAAARILAPTQAGNRMTAELWMPILEAAAARGELRAGVDLDSVCAWLACLQIMFVGWLDEPSPPIGPRDMIVNFVLPSLVADKATP
jgi:AcrR family transcriptional regulator